MKVHFESCFTDLPESIQLALESVDLNPFFNAHFLSLLEQTGCVSEQNGWQPQHLWIEQNAQPVFYMPLYKKLHSWGEFVFDQSWAQAYRRVGLQYYPKLVTAIPFTPSLGPRWWCVDGNQEQRWLTQAVHSIAERLQQQKLSSWHLLFSHKKPAAEQQTLLARHDTQFHWINRDYQSFDDFLQQLKSRKRKSIRREREKVAEQGVELVRKMAGELQQQDWQQFYHCYCNTYHERGMTPYLTLSFFEQIAQAMTDHLMMVQALRDGMMIGAAIFFFDRDVLYGRHWGALQQVDCLHFEACFYQGIEFCIEKGLKRFDPGTQGEHKLLRGFEPIKTDSWHMIAHGAFHDAIEEYLQAESSQVERYRSTANQYLPFKKQD